MSECTTTHLDQRLQHRRATRARRKAAKETARAAERSAWADAPPASEEELHARWERTAARQQLHAERERVKQAMRLPWSDAEPGLRVAIDLGMQELMVPRELASLATQVTAVYAQVLKRCAGQAAWRPLRLALTNLAGAPETLERIECSAGRLDGWPVHLLQEDYSMSLPALCAPAPISIVVLSPDAAEPLEALHPNCVYVIGGLCDYKRIANATRERASARDVCCRRLPIREALCTAIPVEILTVDQVAIALLEVANNGGDWARALLCAVPPRKLRAGFGSAGYAGGGAGAGTTEVVGGGARTH
uniref:tRNA (guanine(9)-N(1))-methyltransferase n=1 Tax=Haptolina ericina TaxID=156174 RepID=A0A7S3BQC5_9EUKA|mmetsp:Transcript_65756/g.146766  ORF Transcript_65756/g.146766 Transcript_65756/m.146766 type:complete len:305 (+) Transcript_65756:19-933(+)